MVRRLPLLAFTIAAELSAAGSSAAAKLVLTVGPETAGSAACPAPCQSLFLSYEDPTRSLPIQAVRFDVGLFGGASAADLPFPPATSPEAAGGNGFEVTGPSWQPWSLMTVGRSPDPDCAARIEAEADTPLTVEKFAALFGGGCLGASCEPSGPVSLRTASTWAAST